ncbi:MAG: Cholesterol oxidase, partial [uncultured Solirubrobacteraceae bacterium]
DDRRRAHRRAHRARRRRRGSLQPHPRPRPEGADEGAGAARPRRRRAHGDLAPADPAHADRGARRRGLRRLHGDVAGEHGRAQQHVDARPGRGARPPRRRQEGRRADRRGLDPGDHALPGLDELHDGRLCGPRARGAHRRRERGLAASGRDEGGEAQARLHRAAGVAAAGLPRSALGRAGRALAAAQGADRVLQALAPRLRQRRLQGVELHVRRRQPDAVDARAAQPRDARVDEGRVRPRPADVLQADRAMRPRRPPRQRRGAARAARELRRPGAADRRALLVHHRRAQQLLSARESDAHVRVVREARPGAPHDAHRARLRAPRRVRRRARGPRLAPDHPRRAREGRM